MCIRDRRNQTPHSQTQAAEKNAALTLNASQPPIAPPVCGMFNRNRSETNRKTNAAKKAKPNSRHPSRPATTASNAPGTTHAKTDQRGSG